MNFFVLFEWIVCYSIIFSLCCYCCCSGFVSTPQYDTSLSSSSSIFRHHDYVTAASSHLSSSSSSSLLLLLLSLSKNGNYAESDHVTIVNDLPKMDLVSSNVITGYVSGSDFLNRRQNMLNRLRKTDSLSPTVTKQDVRIVYEDKHIVIVDKPSGVLSVKGKSEGGCIAQAVFDTVECNLQDCDRMVVHRLGRDTSGLMVLAKTLPAVRGMNTIFRTRAIERTYEALVVGHMNNQQLENTHDNEGVINLPLMRDYDNPPFWRISTDEKQRQLIGLCPDVVGKEILEAPKSSITHYKVMAHEELDGLPVTRVLLSSISGRTHQLNVHLAAIGHPIVGDPIYGINGVAAPQGGLSDTELPNNYSRVSPNIQYSLNKIANGKSFIHAKSLKFWHPVKSKEIVVTVDAPF